MHISVIYALPYEQTIIELEVPAGTTAEQAVELSQIRDKHPEIDLAVNKLGIFAKLVKNDDELSDGDRVEIYRALPRKPRDPYAVGEKKARIAAKKERVEAEHASEQAEQEAAPDSEA